MKESKFKVGDIVEYLSVGGIIHVPILKIKDDGKIILNTRQKVTVIKGGRKGEEFSLCKNVCVMVHRVKKI